MLSKTEQVWRHLLVANSERGERRQPSLTALANDLGFGVSTVHKALQRPAEMGVIQIKGGGGLRLLDPTRLLLLWAGHRNLERDVLKEFRVSLPATDVERRLPAKRFVLGGFGAVVAQKGANYISDYDRVLCYGDPNDIPPAIAEEAHGSTFVVVLEPDPLLEKFGKVTPISQACVDLFNSPGWPAARFVSTLISEMVDTDAA